MSQSTPRLALPYIQPAQAQKHVTHNEAIRALDQLVQLSFEDDAQNTPPAAPNVGDCYVIAAGASGSWAGQDGQITEYMDGAWQFHTPRLGWRGYVAARNAMIVFNGTAWQDLAASEVQNAVHIGLGMQASSNPFSAKLNAALWTALYAADGGTGHLVQNLNKENTAADLGFVLQDNFQTRALIGLFGDNTLRLTTTNDGSTFHDALRVDPAHGIADMPTLPRFSAYTNYDNYIGVGAWTKVGVNMADHNDQACFDASTNLFTAPASGTYLLGANLTYKTNGNSGARLQGRLVLNGTAALRGSKAEVSGTHLSEETTLPLQAFASLNSGDTIELQANFRAFDGYVMADETCFWGMKAG